MHNPQKAKTLFPHSGIFSLSHPVNDWTRKFHFPGNSPGDWLYRKSGNDGLAFHLARKVSPLKEVIPFAGNETLFSLFNLRRKT